MPWKDESYYQLLPLSLSVSWFSQREQFCSTALIYNSVLLHDGPWSNGDVWPRTETSEIMSANKSLLLFNCFLRYLLKKQKSLIYLNITEDIFFTSLKYVWPLCFKYRLITSVSFI